MYLLALIKIVTLRYYHVTKLLNLMNWYLKCLRQYADFSGRARRTEYWMFTLFNVIIVVLLYALLVVGLAMDKPALGAVSIGALWLYNLAVLVPTLAVAVRRLHDIGKEGWNILLGLIPLVGPFVLLYFYVQDSEPGENQWGPNPKETTV